MMFNICHFYNLRCFLHNSSAWSANWAISSADSPSFIFWTYYKAFSDLYSINFKKWSPVNFLNFAAFLFTALILLRLITRKSCINEVIWKFKSLILLRWLNLLFERWWLQMLIRLFSFMLLFLAFFLNCLWTWKINSFLCWLDDLLLRDLTFHAFWI